MSHRERCHLSEWQYGYKYQTSYAGSHTCNLVRREAGKWAIYGSASSWVVFRDAGIDQRRQPTCYTYPQALHVLATTGEPLATNLSGHTLHVIGDGWVIRDGFGLAELATDNPASAASFFNGTDWVTRSRTC